MFELVSSRGPGPPPLFAGRPPLRRLDGRPLAVLVVEDEALVALDLSTTIEELGGTVIGTAATVREAKDLAVRNVPDAVLMDIRLPDGDGVEAAAMIRRGTQPYIVFISGNTDPQTRQRIMRFGNAPLVAKPVTVDALLRALGPALD